MPQVTKKCSFVLADLRLFFGRTRVVHLQEFGFLKNEAFTVASNVRFLQVVVRVKSEEIVSDSILFICRVWLSLIVLFCVCVVTVLYACIARMLSIK